MGKQTIVLLVDDLTEETIREGEGETIRFAFDGNFFEIDLSSHNAAAFREVLDRHARAGRKISKSLRRSSGSRGRVKSSHDPQAVRAWAHGAGIDVPKKGRIPQSVIDRYTVRDGESATAENAGADSEQQHDQHEGWG